MKNKSAAWAAVCLALLGAALVIGLAGAPSRAQGGGYDLSWWTVDGGGAAGSGGRYAVIGTIGQPDAGRGSGGTYILSGGFWGIGSPVGGSDPHTIYLPVVQRQ